MAREVGSHLTYGERCQIYVLLQRGISQRAIARQLEVNQSTIAREIQRNKSGRGYRYQHAQNLAEQRSTQASSTPHKMTSENVFLIKKILLATQASPIQISGRLLLMHGIKISHETIYRFIWLDKRQGGDLYKHLRHRTKKYNRRSSKNAGRGLIPNRVGIEKRPAIVDRKVRFGDFELDTIIGANHQGAIVSIVDRASKFCYLDLVPKATSANIQDSLIKKLSPLAKNGLLHTYTADNGKEFAAHQEVVNCLGGKFYFARPYHSWERGLNEHTNGLVRQYLPKDTDFSKITKAQVVEIEDILNNRPRKVLNFSTPQEISDKFCLRATAV